MKQIHYIFTLLVVLMSSLQLKAQEKPANLWFQFDDRFTANDVMDLKDVDSITFTNKSLKLYRFYPNTNQVVALPFNYRTDGWLVDNAENDRGILRVNATSQVIYPKMNLFKSNIAF